MSEKKIGLRFTLKKDAFPELFAELENIDSRSRWIRLCFLATKGLMSNSHNSNQNTADTIDEHEKHDTTQVARNSDKIDHNEMRDALAQLD